MITTNKKLWFGAVDGAVAYRVMVYEHDADAIGVQMFSLDNLTAVESEAGLECEIPLYDIEALDGAEGTFDFHIHAVDENGLLSEEPFLIEGVEIDFLPPPNVVRGGIR